MAYADVLVTSEVNIIAGFYVGCFGSKTVGRQIPTLVGSFFYSVQLAYVYCVGIGFACCYIDNLTVSASAAYGYCISSVSYTAFTTSTCFLPNCNNTAFTTSHCSFANLNLCCIRCQIYSIFSHNRRYACTGHYTCSNQHCQQLFGRAAFSSMAFCHFGNNDICVARFTPNYFEYFVHKKHLTHKYYYLYTVRNTCHVWKQVKQLFQ